MMSHLDAERETVKRLRRHVQSRRRTTPIAVVVSGPAGRNRKPRHTARYLPKDSVSVDWVA